MWQMSGQVWDKTEAIAEIKQNPRAKLAALFHPVPYQKNGPTNSY